jgi:hypothetical protein
MVSKARVLRRHLITERSPMSSSARASTVLPRLLGSIRSTWTILTDAEQVSPRRRRTTWKPAADSRRAP